MDYNDLTMLKNDIQTGSFDFNSLLKNTIKEKQKEHAKYCSVCGKELDPTENNFTIMFGPSDFKKKASFCALDCLEYFILKMKNVKLEKVEEVRQ